MNTVKMYACALMVYTVLCLLIFPGIDGQNARKPNFLLLLADDMGYGDLESYGHPSQETGPIDQLARDGVKFTNFYSMGSVCTPSRSALLTGRLPPRVGMYGDFPALHVNSCQGLPREEVTIAEVLKAAGYTTGMVGKWHQGINHHHHEDGYFLPHNQGFDFVGHMVPHTLNPSCDTEKKFLPRPSRRKCTNYYNDTLIEQPLISLETLTQKMVYDAEGFIRRNADRPWFLYLSFMQPHIPMFNDLRFKGKSKRGRFGDQINEMSWAAGEVLSVLEDVGLAWDTLVVFSSDHGGQTNLCNQGGNNGVFRGGKGNFYEGGVRVPGIIRWPNVINAGRVEPTPVSLMDLLPTFAELAQAELPSDRIIDGASFADLLWDPTAPPPSDILYFYCGDILIAVRYNQFKVFYRIQNITSVDELARDCPDCCPGGDYKRFDWAIAFCQHASIPKEPVIYNIEHDPRELYALDNTDYAELLQQIQELVDKKEQTLEKDYLKLTDSKFWKSSVESCCNPPYCVCNRS